MTDTKVDYPYRIGIGYDSGHYTAIGNIVRISQRLVAPEGDMVRPIEVINTMKPATAGQRHRYREMEVMLDSDNVEAFTTQQVVNGDAGSRALQDSDLNDPIGYLLFQYKKTDATNISHLFASGKSWLTYARGIVTNEHGNQRNPTTYRFVCIGTRTAGTTSLGTAIATDRKYDGIASVDVNGSLATNILSYEWEFITDMEVMTMPNILPGLSVKEWTGKYWLVKVTLDSYSSIFDSYINDSGAGAVIPSFTVNLTGVLYDGTVITGTHTYEASKCWVRRVDPDPEAIWQGDRLPATYEILCIGTRTVTHSA